MTTLSERNLVSKINEANITDYIGKTLWMTTYDSKGDVFSPYQDVRPAAFIILPEILKEIDINKDVDRGVTRARYRGNAFQNLIKKYMRVRDIDGKFKKKNSRLLSHRNKRDMGVFETEEDALKWYLALKAEVFRFKDDRIRSLLSELDEVNEFVEEQCMEDTPGWTASLYLNDLK